MAQKVYYKLNPVSGSYERVFPGRRQRLMHYAGRLVAMFFGAVVMMCVLYYFFELPRERKLRLEKEQLAQSVDLLSHRADEAISVLEDVAERDNNFIRVMMGEEALPMGSRYAGLERQRNYERLDSLPDAAIVEGLTAKLDRLDQMLYSQIRSYDYLAEVASAQSDRIAHTPAIQPVPERFLRTMASGYGYRVDPIYGTTKFHEGMDFSAPIGTPVYATADGTVRTASRQGLYGNMIEIDHGYNYTTRYAHLSQIDVRPGQSVRRGDQIGLVGNTGKSTGPHLHYEVRLRNAAQNPLNYYYYDLSPEQYDEIVQMAENAGHVMD